MPVDKPVRVLLILGHPRKQSLGSALFQAFRTGLVEAGVEYRELVVADLQFDPDLHEVSPSDQWLEADLQRAQQLILWAGHLAPAWGSAGCAPCV